MEQILITVTGISHYYGKTPFKIGTEIFLEKEASNEFDWEAIRVYMPHIDTVGYVANSPNTVYQGTYSAGRLYDRIPNRARAKVILVTHSSVVAQLLPGQAEAPQIRKKYRIDRPWK